MCAIIGLYLESPTIEQLQTLDKVLIESQIRGKHATGFSVVTPDKELFTHSAPVCAEEFVKADAWAKAKSQRYEDKLILIAHCRYSTSDLQYNQPLQEDSLAIVHNGVVTQEPPEQWSTFGYSLSTSNDSELILKALSNGENALTRFPNASMSVVSLNAKSGRLRYFHNYKRPMWQTNLPNGCFITSTEDIAIRAGLSEAFSVYTDTPYGINF